MSQTKTEYETAYPSIAQLTESERHDLLSNERRRIVLSALAGYTAPIDLSTLAPEIATREEGRDPTNGDSIEHIRVTLHHTHLPKLEACGVVDYDTDARRIRTV